MTGEDFRKVGKRIKVRRNHSRCLSRAERRPATNTCACLCLCVCVSYPEALKMAGLQQVSQIEDLPDGAFLLLRHCSQGKRTQTVRTQVDHEEIPVST